MILAFEPRINKNIDLVKKKKGFFSCKYASCYKKFKNGLSKTSSIVHYVVKELVTKCINMLSKFGINLE